MGLVTAKEVAKSINAEKYGVLGTFAGWILMKVLKISTLNKVMIEINICMMLNSLMLFLKI
jgi:hypothetical protein